MDFLLLLVRFASSMVCSYDLGLTELQSVAEIGVQKEERRGSRWRGKIRGGV